VVFANAGSRPKRGSGGRQSTNVVNEWHQSSQAPPGENTSKTISYALLSDYNKNTDLEQVALDFRIMKTLGVDTWRGSFGWDDYEPQKGTYDFTWLHKFANLAQTYGIKLRPYVAYTAPWAGNGGTDSYYWNDPPRRLHDWYCFLDALSREMSVHGNIRSYEIYNEVNDSVWWDGTVTEYNQVLRVGAAAIRHGDPKAQVVMSGLVFPDYDWMLAICETYHDGNRFDVAPFHAYPETWESSTVETYLDVHYYAYYVPEVKYQCGNQPIWINELGFATTKGKTEHEQAYWWARAFSTYLSDPNIQELGIYEIKDLPPGNGVIGGDANYHLGITRKDRTPKLAYFTIGMLVKLLKPGHITTADRELSVTVTANSEVEPHYHLFKRPDGHQILFAYDKRANAKINISLMTPGRRAIAYSLDGRSAPYASFDGFTLRDVELSPGQISIFEIVP
jgi:polysaccharide biosynthesis protein PslG